jgi:hypothetical protein
LRHAGARLPSSGWCATAGKARNFQHPARYTELSPTRFKDVAETLLLKGRAVATTCVLGDCE